MKRKLSILVAFVLFAGMLACQKDDFDDVVEIEARKDALTQKRDSLERIGGIIEYSINAVNANGSYWFTKSPKNVEGVTITCAQFGRSETKVTDQSGIAVFSDLRVGTVNVCMIAEGYAEVNFVAQLVPNRQTDPADELNIWYGVKRFAATMVPMFSFTENTSQLSGIITYENDLTNFEREAADDVVVVATIDVDDTDFQDTYIMEGAGDGTDAQDFTGLIQQIAYTGTDFITTTDSEGAYELTVPSTSNGLVYKLTVGDFAREQTLLVNGLDGMPVYFNFNSNGDNEKTVRTIFSQNIAADAIPSVDEAFVKISKPTEQTGTQAWASANITGDGEIGSIDIDDNGAGYTAPPSVTIYSATSNFQGTQAIATATVSSGMVTGINMSSTGSGYFGTNTPGSAENAEGWGPGFISIRAQGNKPIVEDVYMGTGHHEGTVIF